MSSIVFSAMRPTGKLHLGHLLGAISNWIELQKSNQCIFAIADWHALMGEYETQSKSMPQFSVDMALDWLACGINPNKSIIYVQSDVPAHLELQMFLSCLTPLGWLERNPTYKEQLREITTRDLQTYAFLGYPVLQAADILLYKAQGVPIGEDQLAHLELCREIGRRFNFIYGREVFPDCKPILTATPKLLGVDNRKMSKSYDNAINLSDNKEDTLAKVKKMITDPQRLRKTDPGHPDVCNVFQYYKCFAPQSVEEVRTWCTTAAKGCIDCKVQLANYMETHLAVIREKRQELAKKPDTVKDILRDGAIKARRLADQTMQEVKAAVYGI